MPTDLQSIKKETALLSTVDRRALTLGAKIERASWERWTWSFVRRLRLVLVFPSQMEVERRTSGLMYQMPPKVPNLWCVILARK